MFLSRSYAEWAARSYSSRLSSCLLPARRLGPKGSLSPHARFNTAATLPESPSPRYSQSFLASERFGQPLHSSHPHLIAPGELTPGIQETEYAQRRKELMDLLPAGGLVICTAGDLKFMSGQIFYKFRQASCFWYLTGIEEQDSAILLEKTSDAKGYRMHLFVKERDSYDELWNGPRTGVSRAREVFGADEVADISQLAKILKPLAKAASYVYTDIPTHSSHPAHPSSVATLPIRKTVLSYLNRPTSKSDYERIMGVLSKVTTRSLSDVVAKFRKIKSPPEQSLMRKAADVSGTAHAKTMRFGNQAKTEAQLAAHFEYICAREGAQRPAYVPVVACGANGLIIHYTNNDCLLKEGEMVLMDAGCELNGYASDITRTYPVSSSGRFTPPQRELYSAILGVQKHLITLCTEDAHESLNSLHTKSVEMLGMALAGIGFDLGAGNRQMDRLYPHFLSHPIGIDLHETSMERHQFLMSGQVITIEPGVYVPPDPAFPKWFHNLGIRIEDEVLVEREGSRVLSVNAPKEVADVEATCQGLLGVGPY
ncbi:peptidase M24 [Ceratobasidium sp. AG-I]|nr:peptidase M24 [Ceratobasidium sp. AG-I]